MSTYQLLSYWGYWGSVCWAVTQWLPTFKVQQYISVWLRTHKSAQGVEPTVAAAPFDAAHSRANKSRRSHQPASCTHWSKSRPRVAGLMPIWVFTHGGVCSEIIPVLTQLLTPEDVLSVAQKALQLRRNALISVLARHCAFVGLLLQASFFTFSDLQTWAALPPFIGPF